MLISFGGIFARTVTFPMDFHWSLQSREMGSAPRNPAPRNHFWAWIVRPSGCHCTDAFGGTNISQSADPSWEHLPFLWSTACSKGLWLFRAPACDPPPPGRNLSYEECFRPAETRLAQTNINSLKPPLASLNIPWHLSDIKAIYCILSQPSLSQPGPLLI